MHAFVKFCYYVSVAFFLFWLFFSYYQFPEYVPVSYSENLQMNKYYAKNYLFYIGGGVFLLVNLLTMILRNALKNVPFSLLPLPNKAFWLESLESREALIEVFLVWFNGLTLIFNMLLGYVFMVLFLVTVTEYGKLYDYRYGLYVPIALLSLWWLVALIRLNVRILRIY